MNKSSCWRFVCYQRIPGCSILLIARAPALRCWHRALTDGFVSVYIPETATLLAPALVQARVHANWPHMFGHVQRSCL